MTMTGYALEGAMAEWTTKGHREGEVVPYWYATDAIHGAGGLRSTMGDMLRYLQANVGPPENELERAMRAAHRFQRPVEDDLSIGLAWQRIALDGRMLILHGGGTGGYSTSIAFDPAAGVGAVLLTNTADFDDDLDRDFLRRGLPLPVADIPVPPETLGRYTGEYRLASGRSLFIRLEDGGYLTLQAPGNVRFRLHAAADTAFVARRTPWQVTFTGDSLLFDSYGTVRAGHRIGSTAPPPAVVAGNATVDLTMTIADMERYIGTYTLTFGEESEVLRVVVRDGGLWALTGGAPTRLKSQGDHVFIPEGDDDARIVFTMASDRATALALHVEDEVIRGVRSP